MKAKLFTFDVIELQLHICKSRRPFPLAGCGGDPTSGIVGYCDRITVCHAMHCNADKAGSTYSPLHNLISLRSTVLFYSDFNAVFYSTFAIVGLLHLTLNSVCIQGMARL